MSQPCKACPKCQQHAELDAAFCFRCGHQFRTQFTHQTQRVMPSAPQWAPQATVGPNVFAIALVWVFTIVSLFFWTVSRELAYVFDGVALVAAIYLVCTPSRTNRANGWTKLALEGVGFVLAFLAASRPY